MVVTKSFIEAWYVWRHADEPYINSRLHRFDAPTYNIELVLDHMASYLYAIGIDPIAGKRADYSKLAAEEISELERIRMDIEECDVSEDVKEEYRRYIRVTRALLNEMGKLSFTQDAV